VLPVVGPPVDGASVSIPDGGIGKLAWSAPEVGAGKGWTDRSDVYSMAHLLFRLLTGTAPKKGADPPTSILALVVTCPEGIATAIEGALQVDPQARPSAAQLAQELAEVLEAEEQEFARAMALVTPAGRPALRLVPAAPEAPADWTQHPIPDASSQPALSAKMAEPPPGPAVANVLRRSRVALAGAALVTLVALVGISWAMHRPSDRLADVAEAPGGSFEEDMLEVPAQQAASMRSSPPPMLAPESDATPSTRVPPRSIVSATERLAAAEPALTECARKAGRKLWAELKTSKGQPRFTSLDLVGDRDGCARRVLEQIQFDPPGSAGALVKEYGR